MCLHDINAAISWGNHQSALKHQDFLISNTEKEISTGFQFPFLSCNAKHIKDGVIAPQGLVVQQTINETGKTIPKYRVTHNQSFDFTPEQSINNHLVRDTLLLLFYGFYLLWILHYIHSLRLHDLTQSILISKIDIKLAYNRVTLKGSLVA